MKTLSILIPVFNERQTLIEVLEAVIKADTLGLQKELVIVDDGSTDGTLDILRDLDCERYSARVRSRRISRATSIASVIARECFFMRKIRGRVRH